MTTPSWRNTTWLTWLSIAFMGVGGLWVVLITMGVLRDGRDQNVGRVIGNVCELRGLTSDCPRVAITVMISATDRQAQRDRAGLGILAASALVAVAFFMLRRRYSLRALVVAIVAIAAVSSLPWLLIPAGHVKARFMIGVYQPVPSSALEAVKGAMSLDRVAVLCGPDLAARVGIRKWKLESGVFDAPHSTSSRQRPRLDITIVAPIESGKTTFEDAARKFALYVAFLAHEQAQSAHRCDLSHITVGPPRSFSVDDIQKCYEAARQDAPRKDP